MMDLQFLFGWKGLLAYGALAYVLGLLNGYSQGVKYTLKQLGAKITYSKNDGGGAGR